MGPRPLTPAAR
jgi:hypothetical protein